jgi:glycosyltransferase involved in cell wall biosynthesis
MKPVISVIIPTSGRKVSLALALKSLCFQTLNLELYEVIVVDNSQQHSVVEETMSFRGSLNVRYIHEPRLGLHAARHAGWRASAGDFLIFIDDDVEVTPGWGQTMLNVMRSSPDVAIAGGKILPNFLSTPPPWILDMWNSQQEEGRIFPELSLLDLGDTPKIIRPELVFGCNFGIKRKVLEQTSGFHPDGMPASMLQFRGDGETYVSRWVASNGMKAFYHPESVVVHSVPSERMTEEYFCERRFRQGISDAYTELRSISANSCRKNRFIQGAFRVLLFAKNCWKMLIAKNSRIEANEFSNKLEDAYRAGRRFLFEKFDLDPIVKEWVLKKDYLD